MTTTPAVSIDTTPAVSPADAAPTAVETFAALHADWAADETAETRESVAAVAAAFRAISGGARATAARAAMRTALRAGADSDRVADMDDLLAAPVPSAARAVVDPAAIAAARLAALELARLAIVADVPDGTDIHALATAVAAILSGPADLSSPVLTAAGRAVAAVSRGGSGGGGGTSVGRDLANVPDGTVAAYRGQSFTITGAAVIGDLPSGVQSFTSLSAAGRAVNGGQQVNGWAAFTTGGRSLSARYDAADWNGSDVA